MKSQIALIVSFIFLSLTVSGAVAGVNEPGSAQWIEVSGSWRAIPTGVELDAPYRGRALLLSDLGDLNGPFKLEAVLTCFETEKAWRNAFLVFGYQDPKNFSYAGIYCGRRRVAIGEVINGRTTDRGLAFYPLQAAVPYLVSFRNEGDEAILSIDAQEKIRIPASSLTSTKGKIGLNAWYARSRFEGFNIELLHDDEDPNHLHKVTRVTRPGGPCTSCSAQRDPYPMDHDHDHGAHMDDPVKREEHLAAFNLVRDAGATLRVAGDALWSNMDTLAGDRIMIEEGATVTVDGDFSGQALEWIRVDGTLRFDPSKDTALKAVTVVIGHTGTFEMGTALDRISAGKTAKIVIADRGERNKLYDPLDLSGGFISHTAKTSIYGALVQAHAVPREDLVRGLSVITFDGPPAGWKAGDALLFAGTKIDVNEDEVITVAEISPDGRTARLARALQFDHVARDSSGTPYYEYERVTREDVEIPVGNLTRNVQFMSEVIGSDLYGADVRRDISRRGHFMVMHVHSGVVVDGAGFYGLGRTNADIVHTSPVLDDHGNVMPLTDANTIGRYALHFHGRTGASIDNPPQIVRNSAIVGSPKHGLVHHGAHLVAEGNVSYRCNGSGFFAENGSEIGTWRNNLAVRSQKQAIEPTRDAQFDFGFAGHGFWLQSPGIELLDNYSFGHSGTCFSVYTFPNRENGHDVRFDSANLREDLKALNIHGGKPALVPMHVPFHASGNKGGASKSGFLVGNHLLNVPHSVNSVVENSVLWGVKERGLIAAYSRSITYRQSKVLGDRTYPVQYAIQGNGATEHMLYEDLVVIGWGTGLAAPGKGHNEMRDCYFNNVVNVAFTNSVAPRDFQMERLTFGTLDPGAPAWAGEKHENIAMQVSANALGTGMLGALFMQKTEKMMMMMQSKDPMMMEEEGISSDYIWLDGERLYYLEQSGSHILFTGTGIPELDGKTGDRLWREYHLAVAGTVAPPEARRVEGVAGLVGPDTETILTPIVLNSPWTTNDYSGYVPVVTDVESGGTVRGTAVTLKEGWNFIPVRVAGVQRTVLVYGDRTPPAFTKVYAPPRLEVHPLDLPRRMALTFSFTDQVAHVTVGLFAGATVDLPVTPDGGRIPVVLEFEDQAGNKASGTAEIAVTSRAQRILP
ncbi:MAG: G8 domain-containing protein [Candidatus Omnitrophica bacterium]|nr:G8 domain-containing protein [Candidatus Omnitrophota bacterium]